MPYRLSRNIEASLIDFVTAELVTDGWSGIRVEKSFVEAYNGELPCIVINVSDRVDIRRELGTNTLSNYSIVEIRIFATSDGQRLDLSDWILSKIMPGINYYAYTIVNGEIDSKVLSGRINVLEVRENRKELRITDTTEREDRYRHLLSFRIRVATN